MFRILINFIDGSQADVAPVTLCYRIEFLLGNAGSVMLTQGNIQGTYHIWRQDGGDGSYIKV